MPSDPVSEPDPGARTDTAGAADAAPAPVPLFDPERLAYDSRGLIPAIAQDHESGEVLMLAWMNAESVKETLAGGRVTYWSRSRSKLWRKGETSGHIQRLVEMRIDCDRDCLLLLVEQTGPACHTNRPSCFFTALRRGREVTISDPRAEPRSEPNRKPGSEPEA